MSLSGELRRALVTLAKAGETHDPDTVIKKVKSEHSELIRLAAPQLVDKALKRMIADIRNKPFRAYNPAQSELFKQIASLPLSLSMKDDAGNSKSHSPLHIPIDQLGIELARKSKTTNQNVNLRRLDELNKFREQNAEYILSPSDSIADIVQRWETRRK